MAKKAKAYVLDTWAVIAYLEDEPAAQQIADLIATAHEVDPCVYDRRERRRSLVHDCA